MGIRDQLRRSLQKDGSPIKGGAWYSKAYHRFFEGYTETTVPRPGKGHGIQRVYTGDYYRQDLTALRQVLLRALYVALFLCTAYLFVSSAILPLASNSTWYVALPQALSLPFLSWSIIALFSYLPAKRYWTIHAYRSSSLALQNATLGSAVGLGVTALATLVFVLLNLSRSGPRVELLSAVKYLAGGVLALTIHRVERSIRYLVLPSQNMPPASVHG